MTRRFVRFTLCGALLAAAIATPALARSPVDKPIELMIGAVRYHKDALALSTLDGDAQGRALLGADWTKATAGQRAEFTRLFQQLFAAIAFPKLRADLVHLETALYDKPTTRGDQATLTSTLVILNPLKKEELRVRYDLTRVKHSWKLVDVTVLGTGGPSMLAGIRDQQVRPIFKDGGWKKLLGLMRDRLAQVQKK